MTKKFMMLATVAALFVACGSADTEAMEQQSDAANQELLDQAAAEAEAAAAAEAEAAAAAAEADSAAEEATEEVEEGDDQQ